MNTKNDQHAPRAGGAATVQPPATRTLLRASQVEKNHDPASPLARTLAWIREFLARPHPQLGRSGPVCPFTPTALNLDTIWFAQIDDATLELSRMGDLLGEFREHFLQAEPRAGAEAINKAILIVFPNLGSEAAAIIDDVQHALKPRFVEAGLMLGEFHAANQSPGLRNPDFRPLRSPVPMLAIRHIVETDLPFLRRPNEAPERRAAYARAYLRQLAPRITRNSFEQAIEILVDAEMQLRNGSLETDRSLLAAAVPPLASADARIPRQ